VPEPGVIPPIRPNAQHQCSPRRRRCESETARRLFFRWLGATADSNGNHPAAREGLLAHEKIGLTPRSTSEPSEPTPDYEYSIQVNPWGLPTLAPSSKAEKTLRTVMNAIPSEIRSPFGLRDWGSSVEIQIRDGRVSKVGGSLFVEGRSRWLNHSWYLGTEKRNDSLPLRPYTIEPQNVLMREDRSIGLSNLITPQASEEQSEAAHKLEHDLRSLAARLQQPLRTLTTCISVLEDPPSPIRRCLGTYLRVARRRESQRLRLSRGFRDSQTAAILITSDNRYSVKRRKDLGHCFVA
jgi:hypothetical protein